MRWVIINEGTAASPLTAQVTPTWLAQCASACQIQLDRDVSAEWGGSYTARAGSGPQDIAAGERLFTLVDSFPPEDAGAIAYHDVDGNAVPYAMLALQTVSTLQDVSTGISHELCEAAGDPECNTWADTGGGLEYAQELCDAVESFTYQIDSITVSDFVLRAFFAPNAPGPYHYLAAIGAGDLAGPFRTATGGYQIQRPSGGQVVQVTGAIPPQKLNRKKHWGSRTYRRGVRLAP